MSNSTPTTRLLWTPRYTSDAIGVCPKTLFNLTKDKRLPCVRIGRTVRYDPKDVADFIEKHKQK